MTGRLVRVLFGDLDRYPKLRNEVVASLAHQWCREEVRHYVAGKRNEELLRSCGAKHVHCQSLCDSVAPGEFGLWYNKPYLMRQAMRRHSEILALDFDCAVVRQPDQGMWRILRKKDGRFHGSLQAPNVGYVRPVCLEVYRRRSRDPVRRCLNTSAVYCSEASWCDRWLAAFGEILERGFNVSAYNEEMPLMYVLDRDVGVMDSAALVRDFEIPIVQLNRSIPEARSTKKPDQIYFRHR